MAYQYLVDVEYPAAAAGSSDWQTSSGSTKYLLHIHCDVAGSTPTSTVKVQGVNMISSSGATATVTPKDISTTVVTATGDTYVEITTFPYKFVRINVSSVTNVTLTARLVGVKSS